jgi:hypothetical protein
MEELKINENAVGLISRHIYMIIEDEYPNKSFSQLADILTEENEFFRTTSEAFEFVSYTIALEELFKIITHQKEFFPEKIKGDLTHHKIANFIYWYVTFSLINEFDNEKFYQEANYSNIKKFQEYLRTKF